MNMNVKIKKKPKVKKQPALLYLGRFQFDYFAEGVTQSIRYPFAPEIVRDLDVVNPSALTEQIKAFVVQYKLQVAELTILLADDILFTKNITVPDPKSQEDAIQNFIDSVPFDETSIVRIPLQASVSISVANKNYYEAFRYAFESQGFNVSLVLPAFLLNREVNLAKSSDQNSLALALKRANSFHNYSMLTPTVAPSSHATISTTESSKPANKRLFLLVGVFGVLIAILVVVFMMTNNSNTVASQTPTTDIPPAPVAQVAEEPIPQISMQSMKIIYHPEEAETVNQLITQLINIGITAISSESAVDSTASASLLTFSSSVAESDREVVATEIQKIISELTISETTTSSEEAVLTIN